MPDRAYVQLARQETLHKNTGFATATVRVREYSKKVCGRMGVICPKISGDESLAKEVLQKINDAISDNAVRKEKWDALLGLVSNSPEGSAHLFIPSIHRLNQCMEIFLALATHQMKNDHKESLLLQLDHLLDSSNDQADSLSLRTYTYLNVRLDTRHGPKPILFRFQVFNILRLAELLRFNLDKDTANVLNNLAKRLLDELDQNLDDNKALQEQKKILWLLSHFRAHVILNKEAGQLEEKEAIKTLVRILKKHVPSKDTQEGDEEESFEDAEDNDESDDYPALEKIDS